MSNNNFEEIKLMVEHVKYKKVEGTLYVMSERIAWMQKQKNSFTISHYYVDIKSLILNILN
jgi:transcription initiation factor TFIIH subunit 1